MTMRSPWRPRGAGPKARWGGALFFDTLLCLALLVAWRSTRPRGRRPALAAACLARTHDCYRRHAPRTELTNTCALKPAAQALSLWTRGAHRLDRRRTTSSASETRRRRARDRRARYAKMVWRNCPFCDEKNWHTATACKKCKEKPEAWQRKRNQLETPPTPPPRTTRVSAEEKARREEAAEHEKAQRLDEAEKAVEAHRQAYVPTAKELQKRKLEFDGVYGASVDALCKLLTSRRAITEALTQGAIDEFYVAVRDATPATEVLEGHVVYACERTRVVVEAFGDDEEALLRIFREVFKRLQGITAPGVSGCYTLSSDNVKLQSKGMRVAAASIAILNVGAHVLGLSDNDVVISTRDDLAASGTGNLSSDVSLLAVRPSDNHVAPTCTITSTERMSLVGDALGLGTREDATAENARRVYDAKAVSFAEGICLLARSGEPVTCAEWCATLSRTHVICLETAEPIEDHLEAAGEHAAALVLELGTERALAGFYRVWERARGQRGEDASQALIGASSQEIICGRDIPALGEAFAIVGARLRINGVGVDDDSFQRLVAMFRGSALPSFGRVEAGCRSLLAARPDVSNAQPGPVLWGTNVAEALATLFGLETYADVDVVEARAAFFNAWCVAGMGIVRLAGKALDGKVPSCDDARTLLYDPVRVSDAGSADLDPSARDRHVRSVWKSTTRESSIFG